MDIVTLMELVRSTPLLSEPERTYWLTNIPGMKPQQREKLEQILTQPIELPFAAVITKFFRSLTGVRA